MTASQDTFTETDWADASSLEEELSYAEILASAIFNEEIVITILLEDENRVKQGLKNFKSKQATKAKEAGEPVDTSVLNFNSQPSTEYPGYVDLHIISKTRGAVQVKRLVVLKNDLPD